MTKLRSVSLNDFIKSSIRLTIPNPHKKEISVDLLMRILKQADISRKEWEKMQDKI